MTSPKPSHKNKTDFTPNSETFRLLFANHPTPMWIYDLETLAFLEVNEAALEKYGYTRDEFLALTVKDIRPMEDVKRLVNTLEQKHPALNHSGEWRHRLKNGEVIDVEITTHTLGFAGHNAKLVTAQDITERKQMEEKLKESLSLLRVAEESAKLGGWSIDLEKNRVIWSDEVRAIHETPAGFSPSSIEEGISFYSPEWRERISKVFSDCIEKGIPYNEELEIITAYGNRVWVQVTGEAVRDNKEKIIKVQGAFQDITKRIEAGEELRLSEERYRLMAEGASDLIYSFRFLPTPAFEYISPSSVSINGYTPQEFYDDPELIWKIVHPDDLYMVRPPLSSDVSLPKLITQRWIHKNGNIVWIEQHVAYKKDNRGHLVSVNGIVRNITERKQTEISLRDKDARLKSISDNFVYGMIYQVAIKSDEAREFTYLSGSVEKLYGASPEEIMADANLIYSRIHEDDIESLIEAENKSIRTFSTFKAEVRIKNPSGEIRWSSFTSTPRMMEDGSIYFDGTEFIITERKQAEEALRESETRFRSLFENTPVGVLLADSQGNILEVNPSAVHILGSPSAEATLKINILTFQPLVEAGFSAEFQKCVQTFQDHSSEYDYITKWDKPINLHIRVTPLVDVEGKATLLQILLEDITERKQTETALRETEEKFRSLIEQSTDGIILIDEQGYMIGWNSAETSITGIPKDRALGVPFWDIQYQVSTPERRAQITPEYLRKIFIELLQTGKADQLGKSLDVEIMSISGERKFIQQISFTIKTEKGYRVGAIIRDITERKQAEEALRQSESRWRTLILNLTSFIAEASPDGVIRALNHVQDGFSLEDYVGRSLFDVVAPESREQFKKAFSQVLEFVEIVGYEAPGFGANHEPAWYYRELIPIVQEGKIHSILMVANDITERKQAEQKLAQYSELLEGIVEERTRDLRDAQEKLVRQEKLAVLGQLAGGVGHELRNPLAVINNAIYYLKLVGTNGNEKLKEYLGIIETEAHTAEKIITDLLDFARIKSVDVESVSVSQLVARVLERYPVHNAVSVRLEIPKELPMLYADPRQTEQVLGNLVTNASQAIVSAISPTGSGEAKAGGELVIRAYQEQEMIAIAVQDNGVGIPPENMKKLFEPLFTTKAKGIGLGLAVSQKLAEANGGRIEVESEAGKGSMFTIYVPVSKRNWNES